MSSKNCKKVSLSRLRLPRPEDRLAICCQINKSIARAPDKEVCRNVDPENVIDRILNQHVHSVILDDQYLLVYDVGSMWHTPRVMLQELMLLRIKHGNSSMKDVVDLLDDLAVISHADTILVGGALAAKPKALARLYQRYGFFDTETPTLCKRR